MKNNTWIKLSLFLMVLLCIGGCKACREECDDPTNPDCPNYQKPPQIVAEDPCAGKHEVSAKFTIFERVREVPETWRETSTGVFAVNTLRVVANYDGLNYKWILGVDTFYTQEHSFYFPYSMLGQTIPIKLIVSGPVDTLCFPNDNGMDTITQYITVYEKCQLAINGNYRIAWDSNPLDSFDVRLGCFVHTSTQSLVFARNFANNTSVDSCEMECWGAGYNYYRIATLVTSCQGLNGEFWLNPDHSFEATYFTWTPGLNEINHHARGRKLN